MDREVGIDRTLVSELGLQLLGTQLLHVPLLGHGAVDDVGHFQWGCS